jgi:hypothetical protein
MMSIRSLSVFNGVSSGWSVRDGYRHRGRPEGRDWWMLREGWGLLLGHARGHRVGHTWGFFHGHGQTLWLRTREGFSDSGGHYAAGIAVYLRCRWRHDGVMMSLFA